MEEQAAIIIQRAWRFYHPMERMCRVCCGYCAQGYTLCYECLSEQMETDDYDDDELDCDSENDDVLCYGCVHRRATHVDKFKTPLCSRCWLERCPICGSFEHASCW